MDSYHDVLVQEVYQSGTALTEHALDDGLFSNQGSFQGPRNSAEINVAYDAILIGPNFNITGPAMPDYLYGDTAASSGRQCATPAAQAPVKKIGQRAKTQSPGAHFFVQLCHL